MLIQTIPTCFMFHAEMDPIPETPLEERNSSPLTEHIEDSTLHHPFSAGLRKGSSLNLPEKLRAPPLQADHYTTFLHSRPQSLEIFAIENILRLAHLARRVGGQHRRALLHHAPVDAPRDRHRPGRRIGVSGERLRRLPSLRGGAVERHSRKNLDRYRRFDVESPTGLVKSKCNPCKVCAG